MSDTQKRMQELMDEIERLDMVEYETSIPTNEYINDEKSETTSSATPTCWGTLQDEEFVPAFKSVTKVPSGIYEVVWNRQLNQHTVILIIIKIY